MKKTIAIILCLMLAGCSAIPPELLSVIYTPTIPPPTKAVTPTRTPTITPTRPTPTFTSTPTLSGVTPTDTQQPTPTIDLSATVTVVIPTETRVATETPTPPGKYGGFSSVYIEPTAIFFGTCEPTETTITTTVQNYGDVASVWLYVRLADKTSKNETTWNLPMTLQDKGGGTFTTVLRSKDIVDASKFPSAWIVYQLVSANAHGDPIGRTQVFGNGLSLSACQ
jgi:hypothetical protein